MKGKVEFKQIPNRPENCEFNTETQKWEKVIPTDIRKLEKVMEELARAPREKMGVRVPGEKGMYERSNEKLKKENIGFKDLYAIQSP